MARGDGTDPKLIKAALRRGRASERGSEGISKENKRRGGRERRGVRLIGSLLIHSELAQSCVLE